MNAVLARLVVTAIGLPIVLGAAWAGGGALLSLALVAAAIALHELFVATQRLRPLALAAFVGGGASLLAAELGGSGWLALGIPITLALAFCFAAVADTSQSNTVAVAMTTLAVVWIPIGLGHLLLVRAVPEHGRVAVFAVLIGIFATDSGAYVVGRVFGSRKLAPRVSPGKTWEGLVGGLLAGVFATWIVFYDSELLNDLEAVALGVAIVVAATLGDLLESLVKRDLGVKDMGNLLPGHGGVLDRIDSILLAGPVAYYVLRAFGAS